MLGLAAENFHFPPAEMFADERKLPEGSAKHPHFLGARLNPLAHLNCYRHRGTTDFRTSAESVCLLRGKENPLLRWGGGMTSFVLFSAPDSKHLANLIIFIHL